MSKKIYNIEISEIIKTIVSIRAESSDDALNIADKRYPDAITLTVDTDKSNSKYNTISDVSDIFGDAISENDIIENHYDANGTLYVVKWSEKDARYLATPEIGDPTPLVRFKYPLTLGKLTNTNKTLAQNLEF